MIDNNINVTITGDNRLGRSLVGNVISEALEDAGFSEVNLVNQLDEPLEKDDVPTLLELVQSVRPDFFNQPVTVKTRPGPDEIDEIPEGELGTLVDDSLADIMTDPENA